MRPPQPRRSAVETASDASGSEYYAPSRPSKLEGVEYMDPFLGGGGKVPPAMKFHGDVVDETDSGP